MNAYEVMMLITALTVFVVDLSGWTETWKGWLGRWLGVRVGSVRPFDCSLCSTWWLCLLALLIRGELTLGNAAFAALCALAARYVGEIYHLARYGLSTALRMANKLLDKINEI